MNILLPLLMALTSSPVTQMQEAAAVPEAQDEPIAILPDKSRLFMSHDTLQHIEDHIYQTDYTIDFLMVPNWNVNITSVRGNLQINCDKNQARMVNSFTYIGEKQYVRVPNDAELSQWRSLKRTDNDLNIYKYICKVDMVD